MKNDIRIDSTVATSFEKSIKSLTELLVPYDKISSSLISSMNEILKTYSVFSQIGTDEIVESLQKTMASYTKINMSYLTSSMFQIQ